MGTAIEAIDGDSRSPEERRSKIGSYKQG